MAKFKLTFPQLQLATLSVKNRVSFQQQQATVGQNPLIQFQVEWEESLLIQLF